MDIVLKSVIRLADQYLIRTIQDGKIVDVLEITKKQYNDLAKKNAGVPPGVSKQDWESNKIYAAGEVRNYGIGKHRLDFGEYSELTDRFEMGGIKKGKMQTSGTLEILKEKVLISSIAGLTLTKISTDAWPEDCNIISITNGVLTTKD
jgi:hypothetical protein